MAVSAVPPYSGSAAWLAAENRIVRVRISCRHIPKIGEGEPNILTRVGVAPRIESELVRYSSLLPVRHRFF
jgi:hypothetical protein